MDLFVRRAGCLVGTTRGALAALAHPNYGRRNRASDDQLTFDRDRPFHGWAPWLQAFGAKPIGPSAFLARVCHEQGALITGRTQQPAARS